MNVVWIMSTMQLQIDVRVIIYKCWKLEVQSTKNGNSILRIFLINVAVQLKSVYILTCRKRNKFDKWNPETTKKKNGNILFILLWSECVGRFGTNCNQSCPTGFFGRQCLEKCSCSDEMCDEILGCRIRTMGKLF